MKSAILEATKHIETLRRKLDDTAYAYQCKECRRTWKVYQAAYHSPECKHVASLETWKSRFIANRELDGAKLSERADPFLRDDNVRWIIWEIQKMECEIEELMRRTDERV